MSLTSAYIYKLDAVSAYRVKTVCFSASGDYISQVQIK